MKYIFLTFTFGKDTVVFNISAVNYTVELQPFYCPGDYYCDMHEMNFGTKFSYCLISCCEINYTFFTLQLQGVIVSKIPTFLLRCSYSCMQILAASDLYMF